MRPCLPSAVVLLALLLTGAASAASALFLLMTLMMCRRVMKIILGGSSMNEWFCKAKWWSSTGRARVSSTLQLKWVTQTTSSAAVCWSTSGGQAQESQGIKYNPAHMGDTDSKCCCC